MDQGGLEIPCKLSFSYNGDECLATTQKLLDLALKKDDVAEKILLKKIKLEPVEEFIIPDV